LYKDLFGTRVSERDDAWDPKGQAPSYLFPYIDDDPPSMGNLWGENGGEML
jgi:hypothetical protein